jgi:phosphatidylserine/phosphatidylglycerophosphate/cardiolipin synthase-like enzyme
MKRPQPHLVEKAPSGRDRVVIKPAKRREAVLGFIRAARHSLLLSIFRCDDLEVLQVLGEAAARGVQVEVMITGRAKGWGKRLGPLAGCLQCMGVSVHQFPKGIPKYHAKYMVADGCAALIGTLNFTRKCFRSTRDFLLETADQEVVASLTALFRGDMRGAFVPAAGQEGRLIVSPDDARSRIEALLGGAQHSIRIIDHKLSDPAILALLHERARHGVSIEVQDYDPTEQLTPHGRLIVIDGTVAILGSLALSTKSLNGRREIAVVIRQPDLVAKLDRQFDKALEPEVAPAVRHVA